MLDNYDLFSMHQAEQDRWLEKRPICDCCGEHIQEDRAFYYNDQYFCLYPDCEKALIELVWEDIKNDYMCKIDD